MKGKLPAVVVVGRTNVGKSTLFNRLSVDVKAIALDQEGVTRDFLKDTVCWQDQSFELIDTGGVSLRKTTDPILKKTRECALGLIKSSDIILFVCDGKVGILPEDREISTLLHKTGKPVLLIVNKTDVKIAQENLYEFAQLGHKSLLSISAQHGIGIADLLEELIGVLPAPKKVIEQAPSYKVVFLGKPNVGKSSLMNLLLKRERAIVSDVPGTTREAIIERVRFYQEDIQLADTPGVRRKRAVKEPLEGMMVQSAMRTLKNANIVLLLVDASQGRLFDQELKLAFYAFENQHKALILLFNKQDLLDRVMQDRLDFSLEEYQYLLKKITILNISCKTEKNIGRILPTIKDVWRRHSQWLDDVDLTQLIFEALRRRPLYHQQKRLLFYNAKQIKTAPITILMQVNEPEWFGPSQLGYLDNILRKQLDLQGVPIRFVTRKR